MNTPYAGGHPETFDNFVGRRVKAGTGDSSIFSDEAWKEIARSLRLSDRELQVVRGTFDDKTELVIAEELRVSPSTIHTHVERLHHKLGITDRPQLLLRVMREFLGVTCRPDSSLPPICTRRRASSCPLRRERLRLF